MSLLAPNRRRRARIKWNQPLLAALAEHARHSRAEVDVLQIESRHLAQAQP